ncbi:hypothetical protein AC579_3151 [Pseudocercospora musae]|uniref:Fatty acid hydroxylase domain-containing protein n=1 Tax=Pseudocercospora musae TaxID=113226 RepID=A0A139IE21_9PEZI|nr:hypothetical protein AC579_3151 [Pseudocercospora musae]
MTGIAWVRDQFTYSQGYMQGRYVALPSFSDFYGSMVSKLTSFISIPLPLLSMLALPIFGGSSTTISLGVFWLTWFGLVSSHSHLTIELYGTLAIRCCLFLLPALGFLAFDCVLPKLSRRMKARGREHLPLRLGRDKVLRIAGIAVGNVLLSVLLQSCLEILVSRILHLRSLIKVSSTIPLPWSILKDILGGLAVRGVAHYVVHRYYLHTYDTFLKTWHMGWQHSISFPFSVVAAYDHPVNFLLAVWMPTILPAYLFRWHVLTWHLFTAITSLEDLFIYSGASVMPSTIILVGMARRIEAHFESVQAGNDIGNFGRLGLLDILVGSTCKDEDDVLDDINEETEKHNVKERAQGAVNSVMDGIERKQKARRRK